MKPALMLGLAACLILASHATYAAALDTDGDGLPDAAENVLGTDPMNADTNGNGITDSKDKTPLNMANPIKAGGATGGLKFTYKVEDNADPATGKSADDHLEIALTNTSGADLAGLVMFQQIKDDVTGKSEETFRKLDTVALKAGATQTLHFDTKTAPGHFRVNPNSMYVKNPNPKSFSVTFAADGIAPVSVAVHKDKGGAETAD